MRVLVCGSRTWDDFQCMERTLRGWDGNGHATLIHGDARGADRMAAEYGWWEKIESYPADWRTHGKAAGPIRNERMLTEAKPDVVLAFTDKPLAESKGTADMVRRARKAGVLTYVIQRMTNDGE